MRCNIRIIHVLIFCEQVRQNPPVWAMRELRRGACNVFEAMSTPATLRPAYSLAHAFSLWMSHLAGTILLQCNQLNAHGLL